ncbi:hypothetical protein BTO30_09885 [Domibacillus antri]|uniref:Uncharacterized protein n=1 Tax=Domibacillus antri TaxID=1714264 RepID=A0A1Q8Q4T7_9BACI|nr:hypothetical protein [Domibacillus antri]OLN22363.1 hypothetical protein BTO30_09885 [Domibacillus antri]
MFAVVSILLLAASIFATMMVMRRASAGKEKDELGQPVRRHPYALNPVIWTYVAAAVVFLGIIIMVWMRGR